MQHTKNYKLLEFDQISPEECPCGLSRRFFIEEAAKNFSLHRVDIKKDSKTHYHKATTEIYYILGGSGHMQLDKDTVPINPGTAVMIKPYCRHRAVGKLKILNLVIPAFDCNDEYFD